MMTIQEFKKSIENLTKIQFVLPNGKLIPEYFHITEMGKKTKHFIDCGNTIREEKYISFQIWYAQDYDHRLTNEKLLKIISASEPLFEGENLEIEVEYQLDMSMGVFGLTCKNNVFHLTPKETTCLANDHCGIPSEKMKVSLKDLQEKTSCCTPNSGCC